MTVTVDLMLSYAFHGKIKTDLAKLRAAIGPEALIMIDSGAFTAHSTGKQIKIADYAAYLRDWEGVYDGALTLDVIGDQAATRTNTRKLHDMGLPVMPIHTGNAPLADFDAVLKDTDWLALGGLVSLSSNAQVRRRFVRGLVVRAERAGVACHILGMSSTRTLRACAPFSCDVSTPARSLLHGTVSIYIPKLARTEQVVPRDVKMVKRYRQELSDHLIRPSDLLIGNVFENPEKRATIVRGADSGLAACAVDVRKRVSSIPPRRHEGRAPGPRICNALVTDRCVTTLLSLVGDGGTLLQPVAPILARRAS